ncbi:MAG TPA: anaerobic ribonucleoside-triphosphate reductase activating protein [Pseudomonas sp.]|nr:anaerobic ribonucleoside-triphosphate reductase activating protein [Pseudomonas sp.]
MNATLRVGGLVPLTTLDFPDHLACVLFCQGCGWRCRYCHNPQLIPARGDTPLAWTDLLAFLERRVGLLQAVVFSGGEPTQQPALAAAMAQVREMGFKVGLHSAGIKPQRFARVLPQVDWVGFDVKAPPGHGPAITGVADSDRANWQSLDCLLDSGVAYECRTTLHWQLLDAERLWTLACQLAERGVQRFVLQPVRSARMLDAGLGPSLMPAEWPALRQRLETLFPAFEVRG